MFESDAEIYDLVDARRAKGESPFVMWLCAYNHESPSSPRQAFRRPPVKVTVEDIRYSYECWTVKRDGTRGYKLLGMTPGRLKARGFYAFPEDQERECRLKYVSLLQEGNLAVEAWRREQMRVYGEEKQALNRLIRAAERSLVAR